MTRTQAVTDWYRRLTTADWTRLGAAVVAVQLATALWWLYMGLLAFGEDYTLGTLTLGIADLGDAVFAGAVVGTFLAPALVAAYLVLSAVLPIRRVYAQTAVPWLLLGPGVVLALVGYGLYDWGLEGVRLAFEAEGWAYLEWTGLWFLYTGLLATFAGGAFALVSGSIRPSERQRRALVVAVVVLVAVPVVAGAAFPLETGSEPTTAAGTDGPATEPTPDPAEYSIFNTSYGGEGDANHLLVNNSTNPPVPHYVYNVSDTHVGPEYFGLQTINVNTADGWTTVRGQYRLRFDGPSNRTIWNTQIASTGVVEPKGAEGLAAYGDWGAPTTATGDVRMPGIESMWVYYDVVTRDGEVERYMVKLERDDVGSAA